MDGSDLISSTAFGRRDFDDVAQEQAARALFVFESGEYREATDRYVLDRARELVSKRFRRGMPVLRNASALTAFLQLHMTHLKQMHLAALFLDRRRRLIACHELFRGTVDEVAVYPREVVRDALDFNAKGVVLIRNDPSGELTFSETDVHRWDRLCRALELVDIEVLDILLVGAEVVSCAQRGWL